MCEFEATAAAETETSYSSVAVPRPGIVHLMLWTVCSAAYMAVNRGIYALQGDLPSEYVGVIEVSNLVHGVIQGAVLAGAITLVFNRIRSGPPLLRQPGHWLLMVWGIYVVIFLPMMAVLMLLQRSITLGGAFQVVFGALYLFLAIAFVLAARRSSARRWKLVFSAMALLGLLQSLWFVGANRGIPWFSSLYAVTSWAPLVLAGALVLVSVFDVRHDRRRDWLHWTGVITSVATSTSTLIWIVSGV